MAVARWRGSGGRFDHPGGRHNAARNRHWTTRENAANSTAAVGHDFMATEVDEEIADDPRNPDKKMVAALRLRVNWQEPPALDTVHGISVHRELAFHLKA